MSEFSIVRNLLRRAQLLERPKLLSYFFARAVSRGAHIRLVETMDLSVDGVRFRADVNGMSGLVFLDQILCQEIYRFGGITSGQVILDVGANCGFFALVSLLKNDAAECYCFEPHPRTFQKLTTNAGLNRLERQVHAVQAAVGASSGTCEIEIGDLSSMAVVAASASRLTDSKGALIETSRFSVPLLTLDDFVRERRLRPDLIKVDVEGYEVEVLRGAGDCLRLAHAAIVETDSDSSTVECRALLERAGFGISQRGGILFARKQ